MENTDTNENLLRNIANELREIKDDMIRDFAGIGQNEWFAECIERVIDLFG